MASSSRPAGQTACTRKKRSSGDQGLEVAAVSCELRTQADVDDAGIELVPQQHADRLRCIVNGQPRRLVKAPGSLTAPELLLSEAPGRVLFECSPYKRRPLRIGHQALTHRAWRVQVSNRRQEHPQRPSSSAALVPMTGERQSLSNCANAASTPSISLPVDVS